MSTSQPKSRLSTTGDLRTYLANIALAVTQDGLDLRQAAVAVKACEQINASLYSEAKIAALVVAAGGSAVKLGQLNIGTQGDVRAAIEPPKKAA